MAHIYKNLQQIPPGSEDEFGDSDENETMPILEDLLQKYLDKHDMTELMLVPELAENVEI